MRAVIALALVAGCAAHVAPPEPPPRATAVVEPAPSRCDRTHLQELFTPPFKARLEGTTADGRTLVGALKVKSPVLERIEVLGGRGGVDELVIRNRNQVSRVAINAQSITAGAHASVTPLERLLAPSSANGREVPASPGLDPDGEGHRYSCVFVGAGNTVFAYDDTAGHGAALVLLGGRTDRWLRIVDIEPKQIPDSAFETTWFQSHHYSTSAGPVDVSPW